MSHPALADLAHRPWPLPAGGWRWRQAWRDLAFIHHRIDAAQIRPLLPKGVSVEEYDGSAWIGTVPFRMSGVSRRGWLVPVLSSFPELNLRTYVECEGKPGVWFFSLDAASWPMVLGGRMLFGLPYFRARMTHAVIDGVHHLSSERRGTGVHFRARYRPVGASFAAEPGTLVHWLAERYCLYACRGGRKDVSRLEVHHARWPLQMAEVHLDQNDLFAAAGLRPMGDQPVCHFSSGVEVVSFPAVRI